MMNLDIDNFFPNHGSSLMKEHSFERDQKITTMGNPTFCQNISAITQE